MVPCHPGQGRLVGRLGCGVKTAADVAKRLRELLPLMVGEVMDSAPKTLYRIPPYESA